MVLAELGRCVKDMQHKIEQKQLLQNSASDPKSRVAWATAKPKSVVLTLF